MFDFAWSEFALIGVVALLVIGPKDMPAAIRSVARVVKKARRLATEFQGHVDEMVREADLGEVRDQVRQLRSLNVRNQIMRTIDDDGKLRRTLDDPVLRGKPFETPAASLPAPEPLVAAPDIVPPRAEIAALPLETFPSYEGEGPGEAPVIVPPSIARRVAQAWPRLQTPAILPPMLVLHGNRRISPFASGTDQQRKDAS
ncbi:Sec-independent protein translocase protein TatB [Acetobacter sp.]|uniref:Sec-independent protein translocase protein TatB n=1 Tax=Acetobacter sp. TaxID=440 RepID=UPI0039E8989B